MEKGSPHSSDQKDRSIDRDILADSLFSSPGNDAYGWGPARIYPPGTEIYRQETPANAVHLIERGLVKLIWVEPDGREVIVGLRRRHWMIGAPAVLLDRPFAFTVSTLTRCIMRSISSRGFLDLVNTDAEFCRHLLRMFSQEIYSQGTKVAVLGCMPARSRLKKFLREVVIEHDMPSETKVPVRLEVPMKHREIAQLIAVTPEHLSRMMRELEEKGVIKREKGTLFLLDPASILHRDSRDFISDPFFPST